MEMCMDDKWKLISAKNGGGRSRGRRSSMVAPSGTGGSSAPVSVKGSGRSSVPGRLAGMVKEQRARFYIMRRCVTMLVCWRD